MAKDGIITRKDIIEDQALTIGTDYAKNMQPAIEANKQLVASLKEMAPLVNAFRKADSQQAYVELKQKENIITLQAINANKLLEASELSLEKIKRDKLKTEKEALAVQAKEEAAKKRNTQLTVEERVQNEINNRLLKQEARERLGLVSAYTKLNNSRTGAKKRLQDLIASEKASTIEINKAQKAFDILDGKVKKADHAVGDFSKNIGNYKSAFKGLGDIFSAFGLVGGITGAVALGKEIFNTTQEVQSLDLALKSVTGSQENFKEQQSFLSSIANKYGLEIKDLTKQYTSFYVAAKDKLAAKEIQDLFENISKSGSALGLSNETLGRSFTALNQMLSKGTVASEELRGQLAEALPGSVQAMVKAVQILHPEIKNLTEKGFFEMIKAGKILASEVLPETARQLVILTGADKAEGIETITKTVNRLSNSWTKMIVSINESDTSGFSKFVKTIIGGLTNIMDFTGLLFKDENQLQNYFKDIGKSQGLEEFKAVMKNISTVSKEQQEATKKDLLERERENIRVNDAIVQAEKKKRESILGGDRALFHLQTKQEEDALVQIGKSSAIIKKIKENASVVTTKKTDTPVDEESEKEKKAREKAIRDRLATEKKLNDDLYELQKQRLERTIQLSDEIAKDDNENDDVRIAAALNSQKKQIALAELTKKHSLDADKFVLANDKLSANEKVRIKEDAANKIVDINKNTAEEIDKINEFDAKSYEDNIKRGIATIEIANNEEIAAEEKRFQDELALGYKNDKAKEKAAEDHQKTLFNIKKEGLVAQTNLQLSVLAAELDAYEAKANKDGIITQKESDFILEKRRQLKELSVKLIQAEGDKFKENEEDKGKSGAQRLANWYGENEKSINDIADISMQSLDLLSQVSNNFSERKIAKIDEEIAKNDEYYTRQIELAGDDQRQKDLLQQEQEKKRQELEKKKKKEQHKQAVFDKAVTIAQIAIQTALAVMKAAPAIPLMVMAGIAGAISLATAIATPIPKYKHGRKGGPAEVAVVGDGGIPEIISRPDGSGARTTPNKPTLTYLQKDDIVHKSKADYNEYMRRSIMKGFYKEKELASSFQMINTAQYSNPELLDELKRNTEAIKKQKTNVHITNKIDFDYENYRRSNINWRR